MYLRSKISALELSLFLVSLTLPMSVDAVTDCSIGALDTVAGLGTEISISNCPTAVNLTVTNPVGAVFQYPTTLDATGSAFVSIPSKQTTIAGMYEARMTGTSASFQVLADRPNDSESTLVVSHTSIATKDSVTVSALLRDRYGNAVSGRPMALVSGRTTDAITSLAPETDSDGRAVWQVRAATPGTMTVSLFDVVSGRQMTLSKSVAVGGSTLVADLGVGQSDSVLGADLSNGVVDHFKLSLPEGGTNVPVNELFSFKVEAVDSLGEIVRSFIGTLVVTSTDANAELPKKGEDPRSPNDGRIDILAVHQGSRNVPLSFLFRSPGEQTITVTDKMNSDVRGTLALTVTRKQGQDDNSINVMSPVDNSTVGSYNFKLAIKGPSYVDYTIRGDKHDVPLICGANEEGITEDCNIELEETVNEATLFISTLGGKEKIVHYKIDTAGPVLSSIEINPTEGKTDDPATITVISEDGLATVTATIGSAEATLTPSESDPKSYGGTLTAPSEPGTYDITVAARDTAGNSSAATVLKWNVVSKEIPKVQGVKATGEAQQVSLEWEAVEAEVKEYKIYIAKEEEPETLLFSIGTKKPVTSAVVKDLPLLAGNYIFFITAVDTAGTESMEKSDGVVASPLGFRLKVTSGDQSLLLEWNAMNGLPLSHYALEYGVEPGNYTEKRTVNGSAESFMLRDLLPGIEYFIRMTPIALTGQTRADLAAMTSATPGGRGFLFTSTDPVPPSTFDDLHSGAPRQPTTPRVPNTGIPTTVFMLLVLAALAAFGWYMRNVNVERTRTRAFLESMQNRYHT